MAEEIISKGAFEKLASTYGFAAAHHQEGAYEVFHEYLREALEETIASAVVNVQGEHANGELQLGPTVRKRLRVYIWPLEGEEEGHD